MTTKPVKRRATASRTATPVVEAALQDAFRFTKVHDAETRNLVRCVLLAYEVAKAKLPPVHRTAPKKKRL
jgi:hypothetical protein